MVDLQKVFKFSPEKNQELKLERNISFEEVITLILNNKILDIIVHKNRKKYPKQKIIIVHYHDMVYAVPYVEEEESIFLKTIYPSRKLKKWYLKGEHKHEN